MKENLDPASLLDDYHMIAGGKDVHLQHHRPAAMGHPYHVHPSIEINFLQGCDMDYSFGGQSVRVPKERFCVFWAAQPHRVVSVDGVGKITNAYVSLQEFWTWPLPEPFVESILGGAVVLAEGPAPPGPGADRAAGSRDQRQHAPDGSPALP